MVGCGISVTQVVTGPVDKLIPERVSRMAELCLVSVAGGLASGWVARWPREQVDPPLHRRRAN